MSWTRRLRFAKTSGSVGVGQRCVSCEALGSSSVACCQICRYTEGDNELMRKAVARNLSEETIGVKN